MCDLANKAGLLDASSPGQKLAAAAFTALAFCVLAPEACVGAAVAAVEGEIDIASGGSLALGGGSLAVARRAAEAFYGKMAAREVDDIAAACFGRNSFTGDTLVLMADGSTKPISDIKDGDTVVATDPMTGITAPKPVTATIVTPDDEEFTDLTTAEAQSSEPTESELQKKTLTTTWHHPFWNATTKQWTNASELHAGDKLRQPDGTTVTVTAVRNYHRSAVTFNLTIADLHTYYVLAGSTPVLVHNSSEACPIHLALGLESIRGQEVGTLDRFAQQQGAVTYKNGPFGDLIPRGVATPEALSKMMDRVVTGGGKISFNMKGIQDVDGILGGKDYGNGYTSHELRYICGNATVRAAATFFNGNAPC